MKNLFTLFLVVSLMDAKAVSMGDIVGQITVAESGLPVAFAEIVFENKMDRIVVSANEYGHYYALHLPTGSYEMRIAYNERTFVMKKVHVYDSYTSEIDYHVSDDCSLPFMVQVEQKENVMSSVTSNDIKLNNSNRHQPTQNLGDALSTHAGVDVRNGRLFIKGSDQVKFFVDGTPVMGPSSIGRIW